jgi:hypothetical protein
MQHGEKAMATPSSKDLHGKGPYIDDQTDEARRRTTSATSQGELKVPRTRKEDLPEADRDDFHNGVYSGPGTGVAPGHTDTGGADTSSMEEHPKMGTTGETVGGTSAGGSIDRSSSLSDMDGQLGKPHKTRPSGS